MKQKLILLLAAVMMCCNGVWAQTEPTNGDGSKGNPYQIANIENLKWFAKEVNGGNTTICAILVADITMNTGVLDAEGNLNGETFETWTPIGGGGTSEQDKGQTYKGEFNGNGHTISGLYVNNAGLYKVGLFGYTSDDDTGSGYENRAYIHDLGIKDSYFHGLDCIGGICGDLGRGTIENCWSSATVSGASRGGGIAGTCYQKGTIKNCYNVGKVSASGELKRYGGICGEVCVNTEGNPSVSYCYSLEGKCDKLYYTQEEPEIENSAIKNANSFTNGEVCWLLNGSKVGTKWRQQIGSNSYPIFTGNLLVNHDANGYYNETMCESEANGHVHNFTRTEITKCDGSTLVYWHCDACGKDFKDDVRTQEETDEVKKHSEHLPQVVMGIVPTATTEGHYGYYHCTHCNNEFMDDLCTTAKFAEQDMIVPVAQNNEIWYTTTDNQKLKPHRTSVFGATYNDANNVYQYGLGKISFDKDVTKIDDDAFLNCSSLQSVTIPNSVNSIGSYAFLSCSLRSVIIPGSVTNIGGSAFTHCSSLQSVIFKSIPQKFGTYTFNEFTTASSSKYTFNDPFFGCWALYSKILDLTDSEKPYISSSWPCQYPDVKGEIPNNWHDLTFSEVKYTRSLAKDKWGTIVLPFVPESGLDNLKFYELKEMTTESGGALTFTKVETIAAGVPYLFKNTSTSADFTLTKANLATADFVLTPQDQDPVNGFTMKGSFQSKQLNTTEDPNGYLYYLKDNEFYHANGKINISPFRAYIEGSGSANAKSFVLMILDSDNGEVNAIPGIMDEKGEIDETEGIYDLNGRKLTAPVKGQVNIIRTKSGKSIKRMF